MKVCLRVKAALRDGVNGPDLLRNLIDGIDLTDDIYNSVNMTVTDVEVETIVPVSTHQYH